MSTIVLRVDIKEDFAWDRLMCISIFHITQHRSTLATWTLIIILTIAPIQWAFWALLHGRPWNLAMGFLWMQVLGAIVALGSLCDLLHPIHFHRCNAKNLSIVSSHGIWKEFGIRDFVIVGYNWTAWWMQLWVLKVSYGLFFHVLRKFCVGFLER